VLPCIKMSAALPEEESLSDEDQEEDEKLPTIDVKGHLFDLQYHPERFLLAASHIDGRVILYETARPEARENKLARTLTHHKKSCRSVSFHSNGDVLYTGSADCSIACVNVETGQAYSILADAHPKPVNCVRTKLP
jgi:WD40 repeat protein